MAQTAAPLSIPANHSTIEGPRTQITVQASGQLQFITIPKTEWEHIREAAETQAMRPFPWFNNAGVFLLGIVPAGLIFLIGWGPVYDGLSPQLKDRYGLVPGLVLVSLLVSAGLGFFFLFLDNQMKKRTATSSTGIVAMMDKISPPGPQESAQARLIME